MLVSGVRGPGAEGGTDGMAIWTRHRWHPGSLAAAAMVAAPLLFLSACDHDPAADAADPLPIPNATTLGGLGDTPGRFAYPRCIEADGQTLWVIDKSGRVQQIDPATGACLALFRMPEDSSGRPVGLTIAPGRDASGAWKPRMLYIADTHYHRVMVFDMPKPPSAPAPEVHLDPVKVVGSYGTGDTQFYFPTDVAVLTTPDGTAAHRIYVPEYGGNDRISVFDGDFNFLFAFGTLGPGKDPALVEFSRPQALQIWSRSDGSKELIVLDLGNHRVGRFTLDGKLIAWIGRPGGSAAGMGSGLGEFNLPQGLRILDDSTALITEFGACRVQLIDLASGRGLRAWGRPGRAEGELANPWDSAVIGRNVYVLDSGNNRIVRFRR